MATVGATALTLNDYRKRMNPEGYIDEIIEVLALSNPILQDMTWMEGNLLTGNKTTLRSALPTPAVRYINRGITPDKSSTKQIVDTSVVLESRSEVDTELLALAPDKEAFRRSEDKAFIEAINTGVKDKNNIENILESAKLLDALYESSDKKGEVSFS
jgi:predicted dehydrogenase